MFNIEEKIIYLQYIHTYKMQYKNKYMQTREPASIFIIQMKTNRIKTMK